MLKPRWEAIALPSLQGQGYHKLLKVTWAM